MQGAAVHGVGGIMQLYLVCVCVGRFETCGLLPLKNEISWMRTQKLVCGDAECQMSI